MVRIRLKRMGLRHNPTYRIVVIEARRARDGEYLESLGHYNPRTKLLNIDMERAEHWVSKGARPSATVQRLIRRFSKQGASVPGTTQPGATAPEPQLPEGPSAAADEQSSEGPAEVAGADKTSEIPGEPVEESGTETAEPVAQEAETENGESSESKTGDKAPPE